MNKSKGFSSRMETVTKSYVPNALMTKKKKKKLVENREYKTIYTQRLQ